MRNNANQTYLENLKSRVMQTYADTLLADRVTLAYDSEWFYRAEIFLTYLAEVMQIRIDLLNQYNATRHLEGPLTEEEALELDEQYRHALIVLYDGSFRSNLEHYLTQHFGEDEHIFGENRRINMFEAEFENFMEFFQTFQFRPGDLAALVA